MHISKKKLSSKSPLFERGKTNMTGLSFPNDFLFRINLAQILLKVCDAGLQIALYESGRVTIFSSVAGAT